MNDGIIDLTLWQLAAAYGFVLILLAIVKVRRIPRQREILISTIRMTLQLLLVGYILMYVFENPNPFITTAIVLVMVTFAIYNIFKRVRGELSKRLKWMVAYSMLGGTIFSLLYFNFIVIQFSPWYDPRYFIPIAGMIIGNSMTGVTLGVQTLLDGMKDQRHRVEAALMLGATPKEATRKIVNQSFDSAILPTINAMVGTGIVFLPGMMTGQILAGVDPVIAIEYQIAILLGVSGAVALTVIMFVQNAYKVFFNEASQLKNADDEIGGDSK
ncbi:putative ABC transport system permease protein [Salsuginibacillus halophilus]|uniref:Putative ABC transport system permease protein n=1 Tax=Salsuginibacillus halophilus TaxID=517424 RepID=A0A2P8HDV5_9BACI|nr:iron export ABC transporter permease subunit FetB [Salsuginibacillus halophilus]PSL44397.1 putative ABC transport system permease protein [Salsuginibacillus halophilus]